ncbi:DNA primase [Pelagibacter phage EXVC032P Baldr]|nr:DNA primase [Pelagibacter phage EXVC032P Baldr]
MNKYTENSHYHTFIRYFGQEHSFQTFCDKGKNKALIKQVHGTLEEHFKTLAQLNLKGAGVFFTVNETDLKGRTTEHIKKVRALFIDLDGSPLPNFKELKLFPNIIVKSSEGKYHCYWLVKDCPLESFSLYQQALATRFNSDPKVKDLPRVMRVAGFYHNKQWSQPVRVEQMFGDDPCSIQDLKKYYDLKKPEVKEFDYSPSLYKGQYTGTLRYGTDEGDRHGQLVKILIAIRMRGESYEYLKNEGLEFGKNCKPQEDPKEIMFQVNDIWKRYRPKEENK